MRDTTKHRKDDLVPKGFLYAVSIMVVLSLLVVFSASLFPGNKLDVVEKIEILQKANLKLAKLSNGSVSIINLDLLIFTNIEHLVLIFFLCFPSEYRPIPSISTFCSANKINFSDFSFLLTFCFNIADASDVTSFINFSGVIASERNSTL